MTDDTAAAERRGVLFVCHANICRSPLAAGVFSQLLHERGIADRFEVDSAGAWALEGMAPHPYSQQQAELHDIPLSWLGEASRSIRPDDLDRFEQIVVMDRRNLADVERLRRISAFGPVVGGTATISLLRRFENTKARGRDADVPDPVRGGPDDFASTYGIIERGCRALLDNLLER